MALLETDSVNTIDGIERWAQGNVTPESKDMIRHIVEAYVKSKDAEFANVSKRWEIGWFWKTDESRPKHDPLSKQKEFYGLCLVDADREMQLWEYS
jgi:hypothetical protein